MSGPNYSKLQAIWDMIHSGQHKQAMKLIAQNEQKYPGNQNVQVMKIMCHQKSGNVVVAKQLAKEMLASGAVIVDENVLSSMWLLMRELGLKNEAVEATRKAWEATKVKQSDSYVTECYLCALINARNYPELQRMASAEFKKTRNPVHFLWSIVSNILQVPATDNSNILLVLSAKMMEKHLAESKPTPPSREMIWLLTTLYSRLGQTDEALKFLATEEVKVAIPLERLSFIAEVYRKKGTVHMENSCYKMMLEDEGERDNWRWWDGYFTTLETLVKTGEKTPAEALPDGNVMPHDDTWQAATDFLKKIAELEEKTEARRWLRRSPKLAVLHLLWLRLKAGDLSEPETTEFLQKTVDYVKWLSFKLQSHLDIAKFLPKIAEEKLGEKLLELLGDPQEPEKDIKGHYYHLMAVYKMKATLGFFNELSDEKLLEEIEALLNTAARIDKEFENGMDWSERAHGDEARQVACNLFLYKYSVTKDVKWVVQCLLVMESVVNPKNNTQLQQWHHLLPPVIGLSRTDKAKEMDLRFIQHESLSYFVHGATWGLDGPAMTKQLSTSARNFYKRFETDHSEITFTAWKNGFASKIFEMANMHNRIQNSVPRRLTYINLAESVFLETCGVGPNEKTALDLLLRIENDMETPENFTETWDTTCVAATLQCAPRTARSDLMKASLLSTTSASKSTKDHNVPRLLAAYYLVATLRSLVSLNNEEETSSAAKSNSTKKPKKGKKDVKPADAKQEKETQAKDYAKEAAEHAAKGYAAFEGLKHEAVDYYVGDNMFTACKTALMALNRFTEKACATMDGSLDDEATTLSDSLKTLSTAIADSTKPWASPKLTSIADVNYSMKFAVPYIKAYLEVLIGKRKVAQRVKNGAVLKESLKVLCDALGAVESNAEPAKKLVRDWAQSDEDKVKVLAAITGTEKPQKWLGPESATVSFSARYLEFYNQALKRISQTACERRDEFEAIMKPF